MVEEVSGEAQVRQRSSSLLSRTASLSAAASVRRPALTALAVGAAAVIRQFRLHSSAALAAAVAYRFIG